MARIAGLFCVLCGFISSVNTDVFTKTTQTECERSSFVRALKLAVVNSTSVTLRWEVPTRVCGDLVGYEVYLWQNAPSSRSIKYIPIPSRSATIDSLEANTAYNFSVIAISEDPPGTRLSGTAVTVQATTDPGPVTNLTVQQKNTRSVKFIWKAPQNSALFEVCVYVDRPNWNQCPYKVVEEDTRSGLAPDTTYFIRVTAVRLDERTNVAARGTSLTISARTICEKSSIVQDLTQSNVTSTLVALRWNAPTRVCGDLVGYEVHSWQTASSSRSIKFIPIPSQSAIIDGLDRNTAYTFSVVAISQEPSGTRLNGTAVNVEATTDPGPIMDLRVLQQNARSVALSWKGLQNSALFEICVYATHPDWNSCRFTADEVDTIRGLNPETNYTISVAAVRRDENNYIAARGTSQTASVKTICEKSSIVRALKPSGVNLTSVTLHWEAPEKVCGNLVGYEVHALQTALSSSGIKIISISPRSATIDNLEPNTAYTFTVGDISKEPSGVRLDTTVATVEATTDPGPVTNLAVQQVNSMSVKFSWKAPQNSALFEVCVYTIRFDGNQCRFTEVEENTRMGLTPDTTYFIRVTAVRLDERRNIAAPGSSQTTSAKTLCETSAPLKLLRKSFAVSSSYIVLSWTAPRTVCGTLVNISVTFFKRNAINEGKSAVQRYVYGADATKVTITSLMANTVYNFTVSALTREPSGRDSSGAADSVELRTAPASVQDLETMHVTNDSLEARWTAPHQLPDNQLRYDLHLYLLSRPDKREVSKTTLNTNFKFVKLEPASAYRLNVTSSNMLNPETRNYGGTASINMRTDCTSPSQPEITNDILPSSSMDVQVAWRHDAGGCLNISYVIIVTFTNGSLHFETSSREFVIRNLQPYTNYSVVVSAVRTDGLNRRAYNYSSTIVVVTQPDAPHGLTLHSPKHIDSSSAIVVWEPPTRWNGQPGGYIIALVTDNGTFPTFYTKNANCTEHMFVHLQHSTYYEVQLVAFNNLMNSSVKLLNFTTPQLSDVSALTSIEIKTMIPVIIAVVLTATASVLIGLWMNRRRSTPEKASSQELSPLTRLNTDGREETSDKAQRRAKHNPKLLILEETTCSVPQDDVYGNAAAVGISLAAFPAFVRSELSESTPFAAEFKALKSSIASLQTDGQKPSNKTKNKFKDIIPYDESRVVLTPKSTDTDTDYINASFIEGYGGKPRRYIAAQGPTNDTIEDFWRMALEYRSEVIVMVTRLFEAGVTKCAWYWPESGTKVYGSIEVTLLSSDEFPDYQVNVLQVVRESDGSRLTVKHFYYTSWPDHGVPDYALSMLKFRRNVIAFTGSTDSPTIVHCSAGVGRTGTYIAIDYLLNEARGSGRVNVRLCVERMREQRPKMVQTREQYAFIYQAVMEATQAGDTSIACEQFCSYYKKLTENSKELLRKEHEIFVKAIQPLTRESCSAALLPENSKKNVSPEILPANQRRPILLTRSSSADETDYINAVFLNSSKKKDGFVVTQTPLPHTKSDFWRMVLDYRVGTIIALDSVTKKKSSEKYWPEMGQDFLLGDVLRVSCVRGSPDRSGSVRTRDFRVNRANASDGFAVRQFEFFNWPSSDPCPKDESSLMELISSIDRWTAQAEAGTILIHCSNGANKSGLLVAAMNALRCAEAEQVVDVYMTGLLLRQHRPQFLCNVEQYHYLYKIMASYVETFDTYSNFLPSSA